jgi:radical SAM protein with 4Fe4S-binding SPASM domain
MYIVDRIADLAVPTDDLVIFRTATHRLALNGRTASWALLSPRQDDLLCALARNSAPVVNARGPYRSRRELDRDLAQLVLNFLVYLPGWRPAEVVANQRLNKVYYAITEGCNLRCPYCYASSEKPLPGELTTDEALRLMDQVAEIGASTVVFTGGEAMMRRDLFDIVRYARAAGLATNLITNGTFIRNQDIARTISELFDGVVVSVDGGTAERHESTRGRGTFAKVVKALGLLNDAGVVPTINHVLTADNADYIAEVAALGERFRIRQIRAQYHSDLGRAKYDDLSFGWDDYLKTHDFTWTSPDAKHLLSETMKSVKPCSIKSSCGLGGNEIYVNSLGNVYPCKLVTGPQDLAGNVRQAPLSEIFAAPVLADIRSSTVFGGSVHTDCSRCYIKGACGGGCRAYHLARSGDLRKNSRHLCRILRHGQVSAIWRSLGVGRNVVEDPGAFIPIRPADGSVHPVHEDWRDEVVNVGAAKGTAKAKAPLRTLPIVGVRS